MFYKMTAGMGEIVFAPLYQALIKRGVRFKFFHRLEDIKLAHDGRGQHVSELNFGVQAISKTEDYDPLIDVHGIPCWPDTPRYELLDPDYPFSKEAQSYEDERRREAVAKRTLRVGKDFDGVVLAISLASIPYCGSKLIASSERWRNMVETISTVGTQAAQLWLKPTVSELGSNLGGGSLSGFVTPFDTWADMTHLNSVEGDDSRIGSIAYFCSVLPDSKTEHQVDDVQKTMSHYLEKQLPKLWPNLPGWLARDDFFVAGNGKPGELSSQYLRVNQVGSERYVQTLPGTSAARISPLEKQFDNLTIAGDWTNNGLNAGCVEAAVMSGKLAANALSGSPSLESIVGFDHL